MTRTHWYPAAPTDRRPSPWWYFGWAAYVNRGGYRRALVAGGGAFALLLVAGRYSRALWLSAVVLALGGALVFLFSLVGIYRMYGPPAARYLRRLLQLGGVSGPVTVADLHIGTWRHSHLLAELLPEAHLQSVNCWNVAGPPAEANVRQLHELEPRPRRAPFAILEARQFSIPLRDGSCDAVVIGFGIHEIPGGGPREKLFEEARRVLRAGGKLLLFEHLVDAENFVIFGPGIGHWPRRREWLAMLRARFGEVRHQRARQAIDLFVAARGPC
jgi:SAM-dependent methyltransferase